MARGEHAILRPPKHLLVSELNGGLLICVATRAVLGSGVSATTNGRRRPLRHLFQSALAHPHLFVTLCFSPHWLTEPRRPNRLVKW